MLLALAFRAFSAGVAFYTNLVFSDYQPNQFYTVSNAPHPFFDAFARYDSGWYYNIARHGYAAGPAAFVPGGRSKIAFFPAYPLLMRHVGRLFGTRQEHLYIGGMVVSAVAFALAMAGVFMLAALDLPRRRAVRAAVLAAVFPFAFFYGAVYSEALFLAATVWCFYFFRTRAWLLGGLCGAVATATRVNGVLIWPALAWLVWRAVSVPGTSARERVRAVAGFLLVVAGIGAYSWYVYTLSGNPLEWAATIRRWNYHPGGPPWNVLITFVSTMIVRPYEFLTMEPLGPYELLNGLAALVFVGAVPFVWRRFGTAYGLFMAANLWLPLSSGVVEGLGRYCAVLFPFFIWLASFRSQTFFAGAVAVSGILYAVCLALFTNIHPLF